MGLRMRRRWEWGWAGVEDECRDGAGIGQG